MSQADDLIPTEKAQLSLLLYVVIRICFTPENPKVSHKVPLFPSCG